jgi:hypothetical protein
MFEELKKKSPQLATAISGSVRRIVYIGGFAIVTSMVYRWDQYKTAYIPQQVRKEVDAEVRVNYKYVG